MVAKTHNTLPFSLFPRLGFGSKTASSPSRRRDVEKQDDWYIPYYGPYEMPKDVPIPERDSWGDLVDKEEFDAILGDQDLFHRYGGGLDNANPYGATTGRASSVEEHRNRTRSRALSDMHNTTSSSSAIDPTRHSTITRSRRSQTTTARMRVPPPLPLDAAGGVDESPMPHQRSPSSYQQTFSSATAGSGRTSLASLFSFNGANRKSPPPPMPYASHAGPPTSPTSPRVVPKSPMRPKLPIKPVENRRASGRASQASEDDYYDLCYSTLLATPKAQHGFRSNASEHTPSRQNLLRHPDNETSEYDESSGHSPKPNSPPASQHSFHPYANTSYTSPPTAHKTLRHTSSAAIYRPNASGSSAGQYNSTTHHTAPPPSRRLKIPVAQNGTNGSTNNPPQLRSSISTPNLNSSMRGSTLRPGVKPPSVSRGIDRWFSAESWCDALFFPRPRFKIKEGPSTQSGRSGRIVSPPSTPVAGNPSTQFGYSSLRERKTSAPQNRDRDEGKPRHVVKSRSAADLLSSPGAGPSMPAPRYPGSADRTQERRPRSFSQNHVLLPTPVPSLTQVLEEGEALQEQRKAWQEQASRSMGNKRSRSLSRFRAKSLTNPRSRGHHKGDGSKIANNIDFLATRTLLGNQSLAPTVTITEPGTNPPTSQSHSRAYSHSHSHNTSHSHSHSTAQSHSHSHSHSNSHSNSHTHSHSHSLTHTSSHKSSKGSPRLGHSRNESWGKSALKKAGALCGLNHSDSYSSSIDGHDAPLDIALKSEVTKIIRLKDPALPDEGSKDYDLLAAPNGVSPAPSSEGVGIALSSPPPSDDHSRNNCDLESISMPGHPYAQRAVFTQYHNAPPVHEHATHSHKGSEYAGPHPSTLEAAFPPNTATSDVSKRHRLPPRAAMPHPYANFGQDPTTPRTGEDSQFPPSNAADISEYRDKAFSTNAHISLTNPEFSNFGVGEALVYAVQKTASKGSGLGGSEERGIVNMERVRSRVAEPPSKEVSDKGKGRELSLSVLHIDSGYPSGRPIFHSDEFPSSPTPLTNYRRTQMSSSMDNMPEVASSFDDTLTRLILPALANGDDLDDFRDLFYKPRPRNVSRTPTSDDPSKGIPSDVHSSRSGSGLTNLVRKLSEELEELKDVSSPSAGALDSESRGGREEQQSGHPSTTQGFFFSDFSGSPSSSPVQADGPSPFRLPIQKDRVPPGAPDANIPEDVESSRASSILERANEENDTFGVPIRVGQIAAMATSPVSFSPHRVSSQLSIIGGEAAHTGPTSQTFTPRSGRNSLHPHSAEPLRSSYATSTTDLSRMSGLSDFPVPPAQVNLTSAHMSILQGYFESVARQSGDPTETRATSRIRSGHRDSHRTTFGGSEDMDIITQVHAAET